LGGIRKLRSVYELISLNLADFLKYCNNLEFSTVELCLPDLKEIWHFQPELRQ